MQEQHYFTALEQYTYSAQNSDDYVPAESFAARHPKLLLLGGVHGNEPCGSVAIKALIKQLESQDITLLQGAEIFCVPVANPYAAQNNKRYMDHNLNRIIGAYNKEQRSEYPEYYYAHQIAAMIDHCDALFDVHSFHTKGDPFVFEDSDDLDTRMMVEATGCQTILSGWPALYGAATNADSVGYALSQNKPAALIECGAHDDPNSIDVALSALIHVLVVLGYARKASFQAEGIKKRRIMMKSIAHKQSGYRFVQPFHHMQFVEKGAPIAIHETAGKPPMIMHDDGYIIMPSHHAKEGEEWYYIGVEGAPA